MYNKRAFAVMPNVLGGIFEDAMQHNWRAAQDRATNFSVPVNILETEKNYELHVVAPGLKKDDFKISLDKNLLSISFEHNEEQNAQEGKWIRSEYRTRSFKRTFTMNEKVDSAQISAKYNDGVLVVNLPKKENVAATAQQISVA